MILSVNQAHVLVKDVMITKGLSLSHASIVADHLIDCELRGLRFLGLARALTVADQLSKTSSPTPITIIKETPVSAVINGGNNIGYIVCLEATALAIKKAIESGIGIITVSKSWYNGSMSFYLERIALAGLVGMITSSGSKKVAPHGGTQAQFSTNPIGFGFPSVEDPVIVDFGTSSIMMGDVQLKQQIGETLESGLAFDLEGNPTVDPSLALLGAFASWGGHKGSSLAMSIQMLAMLAGQPNNAGFLEDCGTFILAINPELITVPGDNFKQRVADYANSIRNTRPLHNETPVRVPFDRSRIERKQRLQIDQIEIFDKVYQQLYNIINK